MQQFELLGGDHSQLLTHTQAVVDKKYNREKWKECKEKQTDNLFKDEYKSVSHLNYTIYLTTQPKYHLDPENLFPRVFRFLDLDSRKITQDNCNVSEGQPHVNAT